MSTLKVDTINTSDGTGNITVSRPLSGSGASLTSLPAANLTGTLPAISGANLTNLPAPALVTAASFPAGTVIQVVNTQIGAVATGTTIIPGDDTIPAKTEGDQYMTLAITPTNVDHNLLIQVIAVCITHSGTGSSIHGALFQDTTTNALAAATAEADSGGPSRGENLIFNHFMAAGTTSATTFKVRIGSSGSGTTTINGAATNRLFGGVSASSITITEIVAVGFGG